MAAVSLVSTGARLVTPEALTADDVPCSACVVREADSVFLGGPAGRARASEDSGTTLQLCPVRALTRAAYRFRSRPFDLVSTPSVAEHDSSGSAIRVGPRRGVVLRRLAGQGRALVHV